METLYYFQKPDIIIQKIYNEFLKENGRIVMGIDHYKENLDSLNWGKEFNLDITTLTINQWLEILQKTGFKNIEHKQVESKNTWSGTLIIMGTK